MKAIDLRNILRVVDPDASILLVVKVGDKELLVEDIIDVAPTNVDAECLHDATGIYLYGDSCDFVGGEFSD